MFAPFPLVDTEILLRPHSKTTIEAVKILSDQSSEHLHIRRHKSATKVGSQTNCFHRSSRVPRGGMLNRSLVMQC